MKRELRFSSAAMGLTVVRRLRIENDHKINQMQTEGN
jgi:hypothetical protein